VGKYGWEERGDIMDWNGLSMNVKVEKYTAIAFGLVSVLALYYRFKYKNLKGKISKLGD